MVLKDTLPLEMDDEEVDEGHDDPALAVARQRPYLEASTTPAYRVVQRFVTAAVLYFATKGENWESLGERSALRPAYPVRC